MAFIATHGFETTRRPIDPDRETRHSLDFFARRSISVSASPSPSPGVNIVPSCATEKKRKLRELYWKVRETRRFHRSVFISLSLPLSLFFFFCFVPRHFVGVCSCRRQNSVARAYACDAPTQSIGRIVLIIVSSFPSAFTVSVTSRLLRPEERRVYRHRDIMRAARQGRVVTTRQLPG